MRHEVLTVTLALSAGLVLGGAAYGAVGAVGASSQSTPYYACVTKGSGTLYDVSSKAPKCRGGDKSITWNSVGPQGLPGATGNTGPAGPQGPAAADPPPDPPPPAGTITDAQPWVGSVQNPVGSEYDASCPNPGQVVISGSAFLTVSGVSGDTPLAAIPAETSSFQSFLAVELPAAAPFETLSYQMVCGDVSS